MVEFITYAEVKGMTKVAESMGVVNGGTCCKVLTRTQGGLLFECNQECVLLI
jgi:hypothetical protein